MMVEASRVSHRPRKLAPNQVVEFLNAYVTALDAVILGASNLQRAYWCTEEDFGGAEDVWRLDLGASATDLHLTLDQLSSIKELMYDANEDDLVAFGLPYVVN